MSSTSPSSPWRRGWRALRRQIARGPVDFVYARAYQLQLPGTPYDPLRGERVLTTLAGEGLLSRRCVLEPEPAAMRDLRRVHEDDYLESLHHPGGMTRMLGHALDPAAQDRVFELQRWMTGGTLLALRRARSSGRVTVNLGGGFHHAFAGRGARFCALNDLAVALEAERVRGFSGRALVVDLDLHDGDGTRSLYAEDERVHTFSIHNQTNGTEDAIEATMVELGSGVGDDAYLEALRRHLPPVVGRFRPELVLYVAGADPAEEDEIGDWKISATALLERDRFVVELLRRERPRAPLAVVLGGGYGSEAWRPTARFCSWLAAGEAVEPPSTEEVTLARYRHLARLLSNAELSNGEVGDDWGLSEEDLFGLAGAPRRSRFLGFYSLHGIELALERGGLLERIRNLGFERPVLEMDLDNPAGETVRLFGDAAKDELLVELRARRDRRTLEGMELLWIEWLLLQNPRLAFTAERPRLPGQRHPGLGMLRDAVAFLVLACERLDLDGLAFVPSHYHLAAQSHRYLRFLEPAAEGRFRSLAKALAGMPLAEGTRRVEAGDVIDRESGEPVKWQPAPMVLPVSERLRQRLMGEEHEEEVEREAARLDLVLRGG